MIDLKYAYIPASEDNRNTHMWTAVGSEGGVHIWASPSPMSGWSEKFYGGVEIHSKKQLHEFSGGKPDQEACWLLGCPCFHDGSSLYFSERIEPFIRDAPQPFTNAIHEFMNSVLLDWYQSRFARRCA